MPRPASSGSGSLGAFGGRAINTRYDQRDASQPSANWQKVSPGTGHCENRLALPCSIQPAPIGAPAGCGARIFRRTDTQGDACECDRENPALRQLRQLANRCGATVVTTLIMAPLAECRHARYGQVCRYQLSTKWHGWQAEHRSSSASAPTAHCGATDALTVTMASLVGDTHVG